MAAMFKSQDFLIATIPNDWPTESRIVPFIPEGKTAHFGLAVSNRSRVAIWALSRFGYS